VDINAVVAEALGRDPTLTDRTRIWSVVLSVATNPLVGTGYESFWLGPRLQKIWQVFPGINEAHNGYLQMYLQLGFIGLLILVWMLISFYATIWKKQESLSGLVSLNLALWTVLAFYNVTEAAFQVGLLWLTLLPGVLLLKRVRVEPSRSLLGSDRSSNVVLKVRNTRMVLRSLGKDERTQRNIKGGGSTAYDKSV